eukprot:NODE_888_length_1718_cov_7.320551_g436_i1.p1 GENE.NODE_888_length_1718_cov_7.320551_g436_i1~~NODE_888_length_1718_cov_7.320551_g436_i1.p1  ORF type:complete len:412 (+),score=29.18 NODE_888_length_1718_cov_7.320551_g436_i1:200-1435(+)
MLSQEELLCNVRVCTHGLPRQGVEWLWEAFGPANEESPIKHMWHLDATLRWLKEGMTRESLELLHPDRRRGANASRVVFRAIKQTLEYMDANLDLIRWEDRLDPWNSHPDLPPWIRTAVDTVPIYVTYGGNPEPLQDFLIQPKYGACVWKVREQLQRALSRSGIAVPSLVGSGPRALPPVRTQPAPDRRMRRPNLEDSLVERLQGWAQRPDFRRAAKLMGRDVLRLKRRMPRILPLLESMGVDASVPPVVHRLHRANDPNDVPEFLDSEGPVSESEDEDDILRRLLQIFPENSHELLADMTKPCSLCKRPAGLDGGLEFCALDGCPGVFHLNCYGSRSRIMRQENKPLFCGLHKCNECSKTLDRYSGDCRSRPYWVVCREGHVRHAAVWVPEAQQADCATCADEAQARTDL